MLTALRTPVAVLAAALAAAFAGTLAADADESSAAHLEKRAGSSSACARASVHPASASARSIRRATLCLLNAERRRHGLRPLRHNRRLARAGLRHARDMARRDYFAHDSLDGRTFVDRILRAGYVRRKARWLLGENLAWGAGSLATPDRIVRAWMRSPGHRRNILKRGYREIGIAVVRGAPVRDASRAAIYATEFGAR